MVKIFIDGASLEQVISYDKNDLVGGFTFNPSLFRKLGVDNYEGFAKQVLSITDKPVSLEVLSDDFVEMERQARKIASWGKNVVVKIPIINSLGESSILLIEKLIKDGICVNITAVTNLNQVKSLIPAIVGGVGGYISIFAGRIADTGTDPLPIILGTLYFLSEKPYMKVIWASTREVYNIIQADSVGCDVITINADLFKKYTKFGENLDTVSLNTVKMFSGDAKMAGYTL
jgi:transaldolase